MGQIVQKLCLHPEEEACAAVPPCHMAVEAGSAALAKKAVLPKTGATVAAVVAALVEAGLAEYPAATGGGEDGGQ